MSFKYPKHIRFRCQKCAQCCGDTEDRVRSILLLKTEADLISRQTSTTLNEIAQEIAGFEPYIYLMRKSEDGKCVFLEDSSCAVYRIRPLVCRFYPFQIRNPRNDTYLFTYTRKCPGIGKGPYLRRDFFERLCKKFTRLMRENAQTES